MLSSNFAKKRVSKKIKMKAIIGKTIPLHMMEGDIKKFTEVKTWNEFEDYRSVYFIYGNSVLIVSMGEELIAVKITSPVLVNSQRKLFDSLWKIAKKL